LSVRGDRIQWAAERGGEPVKRDTDSRCPRVARWLLAGVATVMLWTVSSVAPAWAADVPNPAPDSPAPGAALATSLLGWLKWGGLVASLAGLLIGAIATGVGHFGSNYSASSAGRKWLLGGMGAAILCGLAWTIVTTLFNATGG
jgi:hypothetical protein